MPYQSSQTSPVEKRGSGCCDQSFASVILACMGPFYVLRFGWFWCFFCWWLVGGGGVPPTLRDLRTSLCARGDLERMLCCQIFLPLESLQASLELHDLVEVRY